MTCCTQTRFRKAVKNILINKEAKMANLSKGDKIYVAGHRGLVGSAIVRSLKRAGYD